ncbi:MAG: peptidylprolyl isomerase [bacterium]
MRRVFSYLAVIFSLCMLAANINCKEAAMDLKDGLYAKIVTTKGNIVLFLEFEKAPLTVTNFVGLAEGTKDSNKGKGVKFYDGIVFHRVIPNFMIQTGDPLGNGTGGPGYNFPDEIHPSLKHDRAGILSMANAGPGTNGSQIFITHKDTPWLDGKHTVFGHVIDGQDVVDSIQQGDKIETVDIIRKGKKAEEFKADQEKYDKLLNDIKGKNKSELSEKIKKQESIIESKWPNAVKTASGLQYVVTKKGINTAKPKKGDNVKAHYTGKLLDGTKFDSSVDRGVPFEFPVGTGRVIKGWDEAFLDMTKGEKRTLIIPSELGYGERGAGRLIPPNATLIFDVELIDF